jgi:opacity protein-like surface antigen
MRIRGAIAVALSPALVLSLVLSLAAVGVPTAHAAEQLGWYGALRFNGGFEMADDIVNESSGAEAGLAVNQDSAMDPTAAPGMAVGYYWGPKIKVPLRTELEYTLRYRFDYDNSPFTFVSAATQKGLQSNIQTHTVLVNIYYDIDTGTRFVPYLGAGLGYALSLADTELTNKTTGVILSQETATNNFAWAAKLGVVMQLSSAWGFDLGYQYIDMGKTRIGGFSDGVKLNIKDHTSHDVVFGIVYNF